MNSDPNLELVFSRAEKQRIQTCLTCTKPESECFGHCFKRTSAVRSTAAVPGPKLIYICELSSKGLNGNAIREKLGMKEKAFDTILYRAYKNGLITKEERTDLRKGRYRGKILSQNENGES